MIKYYFNLFPGILVLVSLMTYLDTKGQSAYNPNILPMGDKEPLMANTGTGGLASTGAVFYNPAALTMLEGTSFSLSGTAYLHYKFKAEPIAIINGQNLDYEAAGFKLKYFYTDLELFYSLGNGEQPKAVGVGKTDIAYRYIGSFLGTNYTF